MRKPRPPSYYLRHTNVGDCHRLANTRCGYCKGFGHTTKYCLKLKLKEQKEKEKEAKDRQLRIKVKQLKLEEEEQARMDEMDYQQRKNAASIIVTGIQMRLLGIPHQPETVASPAPQPIAAPILGPRQVVPTVEHLQEGEQRWREAMNSGLFETALDLDEIVLNPIAI